MDAGFKDIAIVDLDLRKTTWSRVHSSMRTLYLQLSREPEQGWIRFFHEERESRVVLKRHGLWIEEGHIVFDCLLDDVETLHLPDIRLSVAYANDKFRQWLSARREEGQKVRQDADDEQRSLATLRARIRGEEIASDAAEAVVIEDADSKDFNARRDEWRARFRAALASATKEPARGND